MQNDSIYKYVLILDCSEVAPNQTAIGWKHGRGPRCGCPAAARTSFWSYELTYSWHYRLLPSVQQAPQQYNLAGVVGSVVADKQGFTENGLAGAMRQGYQQIGALGLQ